MAKVKDRPLLLRKRQDGKTYLSSDAWPPRHEFSMDWLLENTMSGTVKMDADTIEVKLANASASYKVVLRPGEDGPNGERTTGYWGKLAEGTVN